MAKTPRSEPDATPAAELPASFEAAMEELERIVGRMESGELSLQASLAAHKRGLELARYCQNLLVQAQQQVTVLEGDVLRALDEAQSDE